ncbi:NADPH-dependent diflavin oxidoreductase-like protein [Emericellopsis cladophorae]|uniref:NADPH-dependent diflavin oxidoreductase 1 n=1 Tax=Emericellopsis cladophorae TaxID=2686198 RepID=A0A9Q0BDQ2_9HYPO|nr:NADPH-dependent diflavin oxidoreductase-like protein [Emericellopsis cladophorae]KAI6780424.1 NADPH-dependent diflavin oxidoreductase-like protein [Emericellopsis cladophorae]
MAGSQRSALVLYGSETGNAQDMAEELGRLCARLHFSTDVDELDAVDLNSLLKHQIVMFVISTTGQGDMPHNSLLFWKKLLRKRLPPGCLSQVNFTCFGLGDSTYVKFNWAARKLVRRLEQLGANRFFDDGEADEQFEDGIEGAFSNWGERLHNHLLEAYPLEADQSPIPDDAVLPARWSLAPALEKIKDSSNGHHTQDSEPMVTGPPPERPLPIPDGWTATIVENSRLTPDSHWQDVRQVSFDVQQRPAGEVLQTNPGDCLTIYPKNFPEDVHRLITLMDWTSIADVPLVLSLCPSLPRNLFAPQPCTLRNLLLENVDITAIPKRSFLKSMSYFSTDEYHKTRLLEFTQNLYIDEYFDYATRSRRSILEVLEEFTSVKLPAERLFDIFPLIHGRDFSIANGGATSPSGVGTRVDLLVALVRYRTILRKPRQGLCSRYLASMPLSSTLVVSRKPVLSPIHGSANAQRPLIAMATGTGVAPVRCLVHERLSHPNPGPMLLFFGNRNREADYFFEKEWEALHSGGKLEVFTAFSRDQDKKVYIQHLVKQQADKIASLIRQGAIFAVCGGSSKMADACKEAVFEPYKSAGEPEERERELNALTWWQEIW